MAGEHDHVELYRDGSGDWRSRVVSANGNIIFDSAEGYRHREDCLEMVRTRFGPIPIEYEGRRSVTTDPTSIRRNPPCQ